MPPNTGGFDLMFQARQEVVNAALVPILDHLPASNSSASSAAKQITVPMRDDGTVDEQGNLLSLVWFDPQVTLGADNAITLTTTVSGGDHLSQTEPPAAGTGDRIMTVGGHSAIRLLPQLRPAASPPGLGLNLLSLDASDILRHLSYAGFPLSETDFASGAEAIQTLIENLFSGLAALLRGSTGSGQAPLSAFGLSLLGSGVITCAPESMGAHIFADRFAMGGSLARADGSLPPAGQPAVMQDMLSAHPDSNVAITITQDGLNAHLARILSDGSLSPTFTNPGDGTMFQVHSLTVDLLSDGTAQAHADISSPQGRAPLNITIGFSGPDAAHLLTVSRISSDEGWATTLVGTLNWDQLWPSILGWLFGSLFHPGATSGAMGAMGTAGEVDLTQSFSIPGTSVSLQGPLTHFDVTDGALTVYCLMPTDAPFHAAALAMEPAPIISRVGPEPVQSDDCLVMARLQAQPSSPGLSPMDYAWKVGRTPATTGAMLSTHTDTITLSQRPPVAARVWLIDGFGRHTTAELDVAYVQNEHCIERNAPPTDKDRRIPPIEDIRPDPGPWRAVRVLVVAVLTALVIVGIGFGVWTLFLK